MMTDATAPTAPTAPSIPSRPGFSLRRMIGLLVCLIMLSLIMLRASSEWAMMIESGPDAQMPIWMLFFWSKLLYWGLTAGLVAGVMFVENPRWRMAMGVLLLLGWTYAIRTESWKINVAVQALVEARDPATSPARLIQLLQFSGPQAGYELDNRIAANPNTNPEIMRMLYERHNIGTLMILARDPRTPEDILWDIVNRDLPQLKEENMQTWARKTIKMNPKLPAAIRRHLDAQEPVKKPGPAKPASTPAAQPANK